MQKLLYITNQICGPGGLERVLSIKASYFAEKLDYEVHILTLNQGNQELFYSFSSKLVYHDIKVNGNPFTYLKKYRNGIKTVINQINPNVILVCDDGLKGLFLPLIIQKPCPMIYERHVSKNIEVKGDQQSAIQKWKTGLKFKFMDFGGKLYDQFVVLTHGNTMEWNLKNVLVIPNPLSFYPEENQISSLNTKKVLAVGKQSYQKGYDRLLQSWQLVQPKFPDWTLTIYGTIQTKEGLAQLSEELGITNSVAFHPPVKNIAEKYQEASLYVMSSRYEGFGMVLTEAMAYGVPCVSFDCPYGPSDIITDKKNGLLVPNGDTVQLAEALVTLMTNDKQRIEMGMKARQDVQRYLPASIAQEWDLLFKKLIAKKL